MKLCGKETLSAHNLARLERKYAFFKIYRGKNFGRKTIMKKINNMSDLEKKAIKVIDGMLVVWPQSNKTRCQKGVYGFGC